MTKQFINIVEIPPLYEIFDEIKSSLSFQITNFKNTNDFLKKDPINNFDYLNNTIISKKTNSLLLSSIKFDTRNLILINETPSKLIELIDTINIHLIKKKYNFQSNLNIKNYILNLNSRVISYQNSSLKLTERETDIILFLNDKKMPQKISNLQNIVWKYTNTMETHTVETHIYRLRKKIKDKFNDDKFIISHEEGYLI